MLTANDCDALDAGARTGPSAMKTDGAITAQEVERKGSAWVAVHQDLMHRLQLWHQHMVKQCERQRTAARLCRKKPKQAAQRTQHVCLSHELSKPKQTDCKCIAFSLLALECFGMSA